MPFEFKWTQACDSYLASSTVRLLHASATLISLRYMRALGQLRLVKYQCSDVLRPAPDASENRRALKLRRYSHEICARRPARNPLSKVAFVRQNVLHPASSQLASQHFTVVMYTAAKSAISSTEDMVIWAHMCCAID
eukprot:scaffold151640_cov22-Prasinocladus_malaysianus.AAC.1